MAARRGARPHERCDKPLSVDHPGKTAENSRAHIAEQYAHLVFKTHARVEETVAAIVLNERPASATYIAVTPVAVMHGKQSIDIETGTQPAGARRTQQLLIPPRATPLPGP